MSSAPRMGRNTFSECPEDQFYDTVVEQCCACADICTRSAATMMSCQSNCPGYLSKTYRNTSPEVPSSARTSHGAVAVMHVAHRLIDKPLFWTSVVSMGVALLATIGIIVLCVLRWRAASRRSTYSRRRLGVRNINTGEMNPPDPDDRRFSRSEPCSFSISGSTAKNKYQADGSDEMLVSLHSTLSPESNGHLTANRLEYFALMAPLISEEQGPISCHLGTDVHVSARAPYMPIESCPNKSQQLPLYIRSINRPSVNTSYSNSKRCWTLSSTVPQLLETSVKHLSVEDVSSDNTLLSLTSQCDQDMVLPLAQVPGSKLRPSAFHPNDENIVLSMRSETGYRSEHVTPAHFG